VKRNPGRKAAPRKKRYCKLLTDKTVILIVGPTGAGKTAAALQAAKSLKTKIISADSRQCFRELNIGVAKPSGQELADVPHYFINSHSITEEVTAALFEELSLRWADEIFGDHAAAVVVGGTGLYIKAFCEGLDAMPVIDETIREDIRRQYERQGMAWLQEQVQKADPDLFAAAPTNGKPPSGSASPGGETSNPQRLMRALEVKLSTGRSILSFRTQKKKQRPFQIQKIGLDIPKGELHRRIDARVDLMMEQGLLEEVRTLLPYKALNALRTVGYTELFDHLEGITSLDQAVEAIKKNTRHYAKRQMTWFRKDPSIRWIDPNDNPSLILR
jgi:tRNA dimethylallyltransferase